MAAWKIKCSLDSLMSPGTTSRRQMVGVWFFSEMRSRIASCLVCFESGRPCPNVMGPDRKPAQRWGFLVNTVGPNHVDIPRPLPVE
jgi:hypothetical protein